MAYRKRYSGNKYGKKFNINIREFFDIETSATKNTVLRIGVSGTEIASRCAPFLKAFKYYKVNNLKVSFLPASTLPADPSQISYEGGENSVNPTDMMNVGLMRFTNGENLPWITLFQTTQSTSDIDTTQMQMYYNLMLDNRWGKFAMQKGFKTKCTPLVWDDGLPAQYIAPDALLTTFNNPVPSGQSASNDVKIVAKQPIGVTTFDNTPSKTDEPGASGTVPHIPYPGYGTGYSTSETKDTAPMPTKNLYRFQTGRFKRLGWRPTDETIIASGTTEFPSSSQPFYGNPIRGFNTFPFVDIMTVILPRALKTKFAFRVVQTLNVSFAGPVYQDFYGTVDARKVIDRALYPDPNFSTEPIPLNGSGGAFLDGAGQ